MGTHPATLLRRVLVGITNKPEVIALYDRVERNTTWMCRVSGHATRERRGMHSQAERGNDVSRYILFSPG
ncbi:hypothetical protein CCP3SC1_1350006 [Gammaproteobacteria bacterium]